MPVPLQQEISSADPVIVSDAAKTAAEISTNGQNTQPTGRDYGLDIPSGHAEEAARIFFDEILPTQEAGTYDESDLTRLRELPEWFAGRFYSPDKAEPSDTAKTLSDNLKWRKEYGINNWEDDQFPAEYYQTGGIFVGGKDSAKARVVFMRIKMNKSYNRQFDELLEKFLAHVFNRVDIESALDPDGAGWAVVFDCSGAGITNVNMDILRFIVDSLKAHFPSAVSYVMAYNLPWILQSVWKLVKSWLPVEHQERVRFTNTKELRASGLVPPDQWPKVVDPEWGRWDCSGIRSPPSSCATAESWANKWGCNSKKELVKIQTHFENLFKLHD